MANPYPANFEDADGTVRFAGQVDFTDSGNRPGGSHPGVEPINVTVAFNTPGLVPPGAGVAIDAALQDGDRILCAQSSWSIPTVFDGTTPYLYAVFAGDASPDVDCVFKWDATGGDYAIGGGAIINYDPGRNPILCDGTKQLVVILTDGAGGDPGSMQGEATIQIVVARKPA